MNISISITLSEVLTQARKRLYYKGESLKDTVDRVTPFW